MTLYRLIRNQTHVYEVEASSPEEASAIVGKSNPIGLVSSWDRWKQPVEAYSLEEAERLVQAWRDAFPEADAALQRHLSRDAEAESRTLLEKMALEACESFTRGSCADPDSGRRPDAEYEAEQYCPPCRLRAALAEPRRKAGEWEDTLRYAATALEGSGDNGDKYCAAQIRAALAKNAALGAKR